MEDDRPEGQQDHDDLIITHKHHLFPQDSDQVEARPRLPRQSDADPIVTAIGVNVTEHSVTFFPAKKA